MNKLLNALTILFRVTCAGGAVIFLSLFIFGLLNVYLDLGHNFDREDVFSCLILLLTVLVVYFIGVPIMRFALGSSINER